MAKHCPHCEAHRTKDLNQFLFICVHLRNQRQRLLLSPRVASPW